MSYPIKRKPMLASGKSVINGIRTVVVCGRFLAGESIRSICLEYGLEEGDVERVIRHEVLESTKKFEDELRRERASQDKGQG